MEGAHFYLSLPAIIITPKIAAFEVILRFILETSASRASVKSQVRFNRWGIGIKAAATCVVLNLLQERREAPGMVVSTAAPIKLPVHRRSQNLQPMEQELRRGRRIVAECVISGEWSRKCFSDFYHSGIFLF